ncbi:MAG: DUF2147 domain-containing protein [Bacteroidota bacterium]
MTIFLFLRNLLRHPSSFLPIIAAVGCIMSLSFRPATMSPAGTWHDEEGGGVIRVYEQGGKFHGQLVSADDPEDQKKIAGKHIMILENFEQKPTGQLCCGTIFLARFNMHIGGTLAMQDDSTLILKGKFGPISKSRTWKRM